MKFRRLFPVSLLILTLGCLASTHAAPAVADAKTRANQALALMQAGDYEKFLDYSYPTVIEETGGREKSITLAKATTEAMKAKGIKIVSIVAGEPGEPVASGGKTFVLVPVQMKLDSPDATVSLTGSWLAIATGDGPWLFIGSNSLTPEKIKILVPDLPAGIKIPEKVTPTVVPK